MFQLYIVHGFETRTLISNFNEFLQLEDKGIEIIDEIYEYYTELIGKQQPQDDVAYKTYVMVSVQKYLRV